MRAALTLLALAAASTVQALPRITRQGRYLVDPTGARFFIKGIAYQPAGNVAEETEANAALGGFPEPSDYVDPLADITTCTRDLPNLQTLGVNVVRVYSVNAANDHSACMNLFNTNGIYVIADLSLPLNGSINRAAPSWDVGLLNEYTRTLDSLAQYENLLAVNIGNEVVSGPTSSQAAPFVKAAARDIKAYIASRNYGLLVAYAAVDGDSWRDDLAEYLNCGDESVQIDLYGLNNYRWCGDSTYAASGYATLESTFLNLINVPAYFSEFGCNSEPPRVWTEVAALFSEPMIDVWSGGVAFSYFAEPQGFGMTLNTSVTPTSITTTPDFTALATQYTAAVPPTTLPANATVATPVCPTAPTANLQATDALPPTPNAEVCDCFQQSAFSCVARPGLLPAVLGPLIDYTCNELSSGGSSCAAIGANGTTGTYGTYSSCTAEQKLSAAFTAFYSLQNQAPTACDFAGNATINANAPPADAAAAVSSCQSGTTPTFVPSAAPNNPTGSSNNAANPSQTAAKSSASALSIGAAALAVVIGAIASVVA